MTSGNTPNLVLKRILRYFLKIPPLKKYYNFKKELLFLLKTHKNNLSPESDWWRNTKSSFKENARILSKNPTTQTNIKIFRLKRRLQNLYKIENFKLEIKPMIEKLQEEL